MKKVFLVLVLITTVFFGCSKSSSPVVAIDPDDITPKPILNNTVKFLEETYGFKIHDKLNVQKASYVQMMINNESPIICINGIRNSKHWTAVFYINTREQLMDYEHGKNEPDEKLQINNGDIRNIDYRSFVGEPSIVGNNLYLTRSFYVKDGKGQGEMFFTPMIYNLNKKNMLQYDPIHSLEKTVSQVTKWFENSVLISYLTKDNISSFYDCNIYDFNHNKLLKGSLPHGIGSIGDFTPVSLSKCIKFNEFFENKLTKPQASITLLIIGTKERKYINYKNPYDNNDDNLFVKEVNVKNNLVYVKLNVVSANNKVTEKRVVIDINIDKVIEVSY